MNKNADVMKCIREEQLTRVVYSLVFLGFVVLIASLSRSTILGWRNLMYVHIGSYAAILGIAFFRNYLSYTLKATFLLGIIFILGITGLTTLGLVGHGIACFFLLCVISTVFYGTKGGIISVVLSAISISIIGVAVVHGTVTYEFNVLKYLSSASAWITCVVGVMIFTCLLVIILSKVYGQLSKLVQNLNRQNTALLEANKKLENALEEKKRLKIGLDQAQKMELVGIMAGGVVHDLNNVLAASVSYPEILLTEIPKDSPLKEPLETIKKSGLKAAAIVQDLLTLSRRRVATRQVLNLNNIVTECMASPEVDRIKAYHPKADFKINLDERLWNTNGFPVHLTKTLTNLISNAAEAMTEGGRIEIKTSNVKITEDNRPYEEIPAGDYSVLTVTDEGEGISEEDKEKIFEPFYTKKEMGRSGTGLGMTVVWNTVQDHQGYIFLDSVKGRGTTFSLYFPMTDKSLTLEKDRTPVSLQTGNGESILVVDDVKEQREIASSILSKLGYAVVTKASGEEALEFIKNRHADLVILDMLMNPGMDGLDTFKKILEFNPYQKAIISSGFSETLRIKEAQKLGAGVYVKKPYLMETVASAVRAELDKEVPEKVNFH